MRKILRLVCLPLLVIMLAAPTASPWGPATHAYIGKELGRRFGYLNLQEMYGAMVPDFPWTMFELPEEISVPLGYLTHYEFMNVVNKARWRSQKASAYGFATHNEVWGADYWAHIFPGYTHVKGEELVTNNIPLEEFWNIVEGLSLDPFWVAELGVEYAIDILIKQNQDPEIGLRVLGSALVRSPYTPLLLVRSYAKPLHEYTGINYFEAAEIIIAGEKQFKELSMLYGTALSREDPVDAVAQIAASQFGSLIETPPPPEELKGLAIVLLNVAMEFCASTYSGVLEDTIDNIEPQLEDLIPGYPFSAW